MNFYESFSMAVKNIRSSKTRSILTMLGIIIGVAAVIVITGLGNGMENYMREQYAKMGTNLLSVYVFGRGDEKGMDIKDMQAIVDDNAEYLADMTPVVEFYGSQRIGTEDLSSTKITGVNENYLNVKNIDLEKGRNIQYIDVKERTNTCVVGSYIDKKFFGGRSIGNKLKINGQDFLITGVMEEKADSTEYSADDCAIVPYTTMLRLMNTVNAEQYIVSIKNEDMASDARAVLQNSLDEYFNFEGDGFYINSMGELLEMMNKSISMLITVLTLIAGMSLVVGGIGIMNIMLVSVTERTREIGIRKALGAKERYIKSQFVIESAVTSAMGGVLGIIIGYVLSFIATQIIYARFGEPFSVTPTIGAILVAVGISAAIGIFFGYMPAKKAAALNPIDALRYD